jgi:hypothetical protein
MRDAKLTFAYATATAGATQYLISTASANGVVTLAMNGTTTGPNVAGSSVELNYGGLVMNGVSGAVMDSNNDGSVTAADYVRGQILNPLYVNVAFNHTGLTAADTVLVELHGSDTTGFTPSASTLLAQNTYTAAAATGDDMIVLPLQSYAKFLRLRVVSATARSGATINITRMHIQNGREGVL